MGISLKGHTPDFQYWAFEIDGKSWVAINQSSTEPLNISFIGNYRGWPSTLPLINTSGFDILASTTVSTNDLGEKQGMVEWLWAGQKYRSKWVLSAGREIVVGDAENAAVFEYNLNFVGRIPFDGPVGGTVGASIQPPKTKAEREAEEEAAAAAAQISPSAKLSTETATAQSPAPQTTTTPPQVGAGVQVPQSNKSKEDIEASTAYKTYGYTPPVQTSTQQPTYTPQQTPVDMSKSPVVVPGSKDAREAAEAAAAAGPDWAKLALQLGAAYLLLS